MSAQQVTNPEVPMNPIQYPTIQPGTFLENTKGDRAYVDGDGAIRVSLVERKGLRASVAESLVADLLVREVKMPRREAVVEARFGTTFSGTSAGWGRSFRDYEFI
jgi:hypothetical protein